MNSSFSFDNFVLDTGAGELRRDGAPVALRPKVFALLVFLVTNRGRLALKQELLDEIWGDVNVSDGSLNRTVAELRGALDDDPKTPRLIETVARRGYRFIGEVQLGGQQPVFSPYVVLVLDRVVPLRIGENILGRTPECDVQIMASSVSRRHARIVITPQNVMLEDLGSLNGTFVADLRISGPVIIRPGDRLHIGKEPVRLIADGAVRAATEPAL